VQFYSTEKRKKRLTWETKVRRIKRNERRRKPVKPPQCNLLRKNISI
jgi:hypothetical protein